MATKHTPAMPLQKDAALKTAQRLADQSGTARRVYYAYGLYHVAPADAMYYGGTVAVLQPRA